MIKLNKTTRVNNKLVTPFLIQGSNVYCFDSKKETTILPVTDFNVKRKKKSKTVLVPNQIIPSPIISSKEEDVVEEPIIIKTVSKGAIKIIGSSDYNFVPVAIKSASSDPVYINKYLSSGIIKVQGISSYTNKANPEPEPVTEYAPPPVVDNSRFVRPSLNDEYI